MKRNQNLMAPTNCQIFAACILLLLSFGATQTSIEPVESSSISSSLELSTSTTKSPEDDFVCPYCNVVDEMPMELADKINQVGDLNEFLHEFVDSNSLENATTFGHPRDSSRKRRAAKDAVRQATCKPVETIVSTVPTDERDPTVFYYPSCILIKQCGGCCAHTGTTCSPTEENEKQVTIKKTKFTGGSKLQALGDVTVTLKEHTKCRCQCKKTASDCNSLQKFIASQCRCECLNTAEAESCAKDPLKLWDPKNCACVCRDTKDCETGQEFNQISCSCQPITDGDDETHDFNGYFGDHTYNDTYEATDDTKYETLPASE